ncbi:MAG: DUF3014 domain-containing protein [Gammaproteobacteria bacterium]|jgi:hypothetical protein
MKKAVAAVIVIAIVVLAAFYYLKQGGEEAAPPQTREISVPPAQNEQEKAPAIKHPIYEITVGAKKREMPSVRQEAVPTLDRSDGPVREALSEFIEEKKLQNSIIFKNIIRRFVVTVDNLTRQKLPQNYRFVTAIPGQFSVKKSGGKDHYVLSEQNFHRYDLLVSLAESVNLKQLVILYTRYYSLFQQAYEEMGYPHRYFNDRLVEVISHLLAAPEPRGPIELVQPKVFYEFADPKLEKLSAGQKIMIRIGPDNERRVKDVLRKLRGLLVKSKS